MGYGKGELVPGNAAVIEGALALVQVLVHWSQHQDVVERKHALTVPADMVNMDRIIYFPSAEGIWLDDHLDQTMRCLSWDIVDREIMFGHSSV